MVEIVNLFDRKIAQQCVRAEADTLEIIYEPVIKRSVIKWASYEVQRQKDTPIHVFYMLDAWNYALRESRDSKKPSLLNILTLGYLVKPDMNSRGVRQYGVRVGWDQKLDWHHVPRALENLLTLEAFKLEPTDWYREFEEVHPFGDGNGRVGSILYNWLSGTLDEPKYPPDVYDPDFFENYKGDDTFWLR